MGAVASGPSLPILDTADYVRLGVGHHGQLNDAVDDRIQGSKVVGLDDHNDGWPTE